MSHPRAGAILDNKLQLLRLLGSGAMGSVWLAKHLSLGTEVAVKFIAAHLLEHEEVRMRFDTEARAAARINSPHVVRIFDHGVTADGAAYIVMEHLTGQTLADRLRDAGWLELDECVHIIAQLSAALDAAHAAGVVHRDIKPENVFLCQLAGERVVKLLDFGIAKVTTAHQRGLTAPGILLGTVEYMSPEQMLSPRGADHQADLWALAIVAYEMVTGDVPFSGTTIGELCLSICRGRYVLPSELRRGLPAAADGWFRQALAKTADERFANAAELAQALRKALLSETRQGFRIPADIAGEPSHPETSDPGSSEDSAPWTGPLSDEGADVEQVQRGHQTRRNAVPLAMRDTLLSSPPAPTQIPRARDRRLGAAALVAVAALAIGMLARPSSVALDRPLGALSLKLVRSDADASTTAAPQTPPPPEDSAATERASGAVVRRSAQSGKSDVEPDALASTGARGPDPPAASSSPVPAPTIRPVFIPRPDYGF